MQNQSKDPLHGITLQKIVETLVDYYGFDTRRTNSDKMLYLKSKCKIKSYFFKKNRLGS